jgi:hypothetical protein
MFTQFGSGAKCLLDICHWVAVLAVTRRVRHIGQNVLQSYCQTGSSSSSVTATFLLPFAFLERTSLEYDNYTMHELIQYNYTFNHTQIIIK